MNNASVSLYAAGIPTHPVVEMLTASFHTIEHIRAPRQRGKCSMNDSFELLRMARTRSPVSLPRNLGAKVPRNCALPDECWQ